MQKLVGSGVALITPFNEDLTVDFNALEKLVNYNIENGINYLVVSGTTGESATITFQEKQQILQHVIQVNNNRVPIVLGIGGNNTQSVLEEIQNTDLKNVDGILSVSPYYSKPTQEGFYQHFKAIASSTNKPIILYNVPGRTGKNMEPATTIKLANEFSNIVAVKEAAGNMAQYYELIRNKPVGFHIISGDDDLALGVTLAGGSGVISVIGQAFPKEFSTMIQLGLEGNAKDSFPIHYKLVDIVNLIFEENNPAGIKEVLQSLAICKNTVRLPLVTTSKDLQDRIANYVANF